MLQCPNWTRIVNKKQWSELCCIACPILWKNEQIAGILNVRRWLSWRICRHAVLTLLDRQTITNDEDVNPRCWYWARLCSPNTLNAFNAFEYLIRPLTFTKASLSSVHQKEFSMSSLKDTHSSRVFWTDGQDYQQPSCKDVNEAMRILSCVLKIMLNEVLKAFVGVYSVKKGHEDMALAMVRNERYLWWTKRPMIMNRQILFILQSGFNKIDCGRLVRRETNVHTYNSYTSSSEGKYTTP